MMDFEQYLDKKLRERAAPMETETIFDRDFRACMAALITLSSEGQVPASLYAKAAWAAAKQMQEIRETMGNAND